VDSVASNNPTSKTILTKEVVSYNGKKHRSVSVQDYNDMFEMFYKTGSVLQVSKLLGIPLSTTKYYINEGNDKFPCIRNRVNDIEQRAIAAKDEELVAVQRKFKETALVLVDSSLDALKRVNFIPKGAYKTDERGNVVYDDYGNPTVEIDEDTLRSIVGSVRELHSLIGDISGEGRGSSGSGDSGGVQVNINIDRDAVRAEAGAVQKSLSSVGGAPIEEVELVEAIRSEAMNRMQGTIDVEVSNETGEHKG
jgi:hypothetical protein